MLRDWVQGGTCIFVGDDQNLLREAEELATSQIGCQSYFVRPEGKGEAQPSGHNQSTFNSLPQKVRCRATLQLLLDIEVMAHADYFIGSWTSGLPGLIDMLRWTIYNKDRSTFVDVAVHHEDFFKTVRAYWQTNT
jgi:hypothetical protein